MAEKGPENSCEDKTPKTEVDPNADQELDCLLDSALADFEKSADASKPETAPVEKVASDDLDTGAEGWSDEFMQQAASDFENAMRSLLSEDPALVDEFKKLATAAVDPSSTNTTGGDLSDSISQTLKGLAENAEALSNPLSEEELSQLLGNMGVNQGHQGEDGLPDLMPFMKNVMQSLLSKDLLYPSLKDVTDKYPEWLAENRTKLTPDKYSKFNQQYELMKQACDEFEMERDDDTPSVKKERFEKILDLMQKMQDCGQPPKELVADIAPGQEQAANAIFSGAAAGESCSIM